MENTQEQRSMAQRMQAHLNKAGQRYTEAAQAKADEQAAKAQEHKDLNDAFRQLVLGQTSDANEGSEGNEGDE